MSAGISLGEMRKRFRRTKFHEHTKAYGIQGLVKLKPTLKPENTGANRVRSFMLLLCVVSAAGNQRRVSSKSGQTDKRFVVFLFTGKCRPIDVAALSRHLFLKFRFLAATPSSEHSLTFRANIGRGSAGVHVVPVLARRLSK